MMYLVYTALLALNVSAAVIDGFKNVGNVMQLSNETVQAKVDDTFENFKRAYDNSPDKVREKYQNAQTVQALTNDLISYIDSIEYTYIAKTTKGAKGEFPPKSGNKFDIKFIDANGNYLLDSVKKVMDMSGFSWFNDKQLENNNDPTSFFYGKGDVVNGHAVGLKERVIEYKAQIRKILGADSLHVKLGLNVEDTFYSKDGKEESWEKHHFNEVVSGAALVTLTQMKTEAMNAEYDAVNFLYKQVSSGDHSFDKLTLIGRAKSGYILQGGTYEADFYVGAYDSKQAFTGTVNGQTLSNTDSGSLHYRTVCNSVGLQKVNVSATVKGPNGDETITYSDNYYVAKPAAVVSLDNMQVLYAGIENPITVSVPGVDSRNLKVYIKEGKGKLANGDGEGKYLVTPDVGGKKMVIGVDAMIDKKQTNMGDNVYKVRDIPDPTITVGQFANGANVAKSDFSDGMQVRASFQKGFEFKLSKGAMSIRSIEVSVGNKSPVTVNGAAFSPDIISAIKKANRGDKLYVTAHVKMPSGTTSVAYCVFTIKK
ncbi:MAG: hypothetical protein IJ761_02185 [Bacteroidales bacterium]|nr:hypothetical protein [Bacteroidales bacterium]